MARNLKYGRKGPQSPDSVVVFLHGYGADGADLLEIGAVLGPYLPQTAFYAPDAPERCVNNPMGYQWFPIPWLDGSSEAQAQASMVQSVDDINAFLDKVLKDEGLPSDRLILFSFSQGTMMALEIAPRRDQAVAGVVGFSGRLLRPEALAAETRVRMPILLVHGDEDQMVPFADMGLAESALKGAGFTVETHVMPRMGHGISSDGLSSALAFIKMRLGA